LLVASAPRYDGYLGNRRRRRALMQRVNLFETFMPLHRFAERWGKRGEN
jgi:hypothetical protein